ncbi:unnamed protein product [Allacma fusca]|uniref:Uncharacterized protein n=1 Tax=Allacma fusca TaxID=39272 RepID=A0A8J2P822_9HEXA|nr:unnamed protein product [Allacma fusca]
MKDNFCAHFTEFKLDSVPLHLEMKRENLSNYWRDSYCSCKDSTYARQAFLHPDLHLSNFYNWRSIIRCHFRHGQEKNNMSWFVKRLQILAKQVTVFFLPGRKVGAKIRNSLVKDVL